MPLLRLTGYAYRVPCADCLLVRTPSQAREHSLTGISELEMIDLELLFRAGRAEPIR
jgi:hypothetical protein